MKVYLPKVYNIAWYILAYNYVERYLILSDEYTHLDKEPVSCYNQFVRGRVKVGTPLRRRKGGTQ